MFKIIFVIIGTIIGAGFSSGREIFIFFTKYGKLGILGIFITGIVTSLIIYKVLHVTKMYEINNYSKFLERINWKYSKLNKILNIIVNGFLLISFYIMVAGFSSYLKQKYNIPINISSILFVSICYILLKRNIDGIIKANFILVPLMIFLILYIGIENISYIISDNNIIEKINIIENEIYVIKDNNILINNWLFASVLYASYNSIILIPVLTSLRNYLKSTKQIIKISIISGLIIIVLALTIYFMLLKGSYFAYQLEMPIIYIIEKLGGIFKYIYGFIIIASIFTSAISSGFSFVNNCSNKKYKIMIIIFMCVSSVLISNIGFSTLIEILYPLFGILGLIQLIFILSKNKTL